MSDIVPGPPWLLPSELRFEEHHTSGTWVYVPVGTHPRNTYYRFLLLPNLTSHFTVID